MTLDAIRNSTWRLAASDAQVKILGVGDNVRFQVQGEAHPHAIPIVEFLDGRFELWEEGTGWRVPTEGERGL